MRIHPVVALVAVLSLVAFGPPERTSPAKWALVIGISDYIHFGDEVGGDLPGAANDARAVADVLVNRYDFDPANVKLVLDGEATRARIESELTEWLPSAARPGDLIWFYFAGHGSQAWDMDGDEPDGLDETTCPADVTRGSTDMDILDDEMAEWLRALPTDNVVVVWDKCHARSSTRAATPFARPRSLARNVQQDVPEPDRTSSRPADTAVQEDGGGVVPNVLEISAARADEVAIDAAFPDPRGEGHTFGGAFTTAFVENLWNAADGASYQDIVAKTIADMKRNRFRQEPGIEDKALKDRPVTWIEGDDGVAGSGGETSIRVLERQGDRVVLSGGTGAHMTVGSVYQVGGDLLEVVSVEADRATARPAGTAASPSSPDRARLVAYRYPDAALRVQVAALEPGLRNDLAAALETVPSLVLVEDATAFSHLLVRPRGEHYVVLNLDGFPRDSVAVGSEAAGELAALLRREFGQFQLTELENPADPFELSFAFGGGSSDLALGETVSFRIESERGGYLTIVDLAPDGTANVIFPADFAPDNRVPAGEVVEYPSPDMDLAFPIIEPAGRGVVRAFLTEEPMELSFGLGADATEAAHVWEALRAAAGPSPVHGSDAMPVRNWASAAIVYEIRR